MFGAASSVQFCAFEPLLCKQYSSLPDPALIIVILINSIIVVTIIISIIVGTIIIMTFVRDIECIKNEFQCFDRIIFLSLILSPIHLHHHHLRS